MSGVVGYNTLIKTGGTSTAMTDEATTNTAGDTWRINDTAKRVWDPAVALTFEDNLVAIDAGDILSIDRLFGTVTFTATKTGPITVATGNYIPLINVATAKGYSLNMVADVLDDTDFIRAQANGGFRTRLLGIQDVVANISRWESADTIFFDALNNRTRILIDISPGGNNSHVARGWYKTEAENRSGSISELEASELVFQLDGEPEAAFSWGTT